MSLFEIDRFLDEFTPELISLRRRLHQLAELATTEYKTGAFLMDFLEKNEIAYRYPVAETGIVATIPGRKDGPCVALRADMDALPIFEDPSRPFASQQPGVMHACGHDGHMAIALATAKYFKLRQGDFSGCVKIFFQPAEETIGGAKPMIAEGCMEDPHVDYVLGLHLAPYLSVGQIETRYGNMYAASDEARITLRGKSSHGAYPDEGVDAIVMAATLISSLQTVVSRQIPPVEPCVLSFGLIQGGTAHNILADRVDLTGALRTVSPHIRDKVKEIITRQTQSIAAAYGGTCNVIFSPGYDALINDNALVDLLREVAIPLLGQEHVLWKAHPGMGVEDFSFFLRHAPGVFFHLGCGNQSSRGCFSPYSPRGPHAAKQLNSLRGPAHEKGLTAPLHSPGFAMDEGCLAVGARVMAAMTERLLLIPEN